MNSQVVIPQCQYVKPNGVQCGSPALREQSFCYHHKQFRRTPSSRLPLFDDPQGLTLAVQNIVQLLLDRKLDHKTAALALYGVQVATSTIKKSGFVSTREMVIEEPAHDAELDRPFIVVLPKPDPSDYACEFDYIKAITEHKASEMRAAAAAAKELKKTG